MAIRRSYGPIYSPISTIRMIGAICSRATTEGKRLAQRQAVARLMSDVGIAIDTQYGLLRRSSSAAIVNANDALSVFFKYSNGCHASQPGWVRLFSHLV